MIYLTNADLLLYSFERFITESTADDADIINRTEKSIIGVAKTYLKERYDLVDTFNEDEPVRDEFLVMVLAKMVVHQILSRNSARKYDADKKNDYDWGIKQLEKIQTGRTILELPPKLDDTGSASLTLGWGNNTNIDFYI